MAFAYNPRPAPMAVNAGACSSTSGSMPAFLRAIAAASPPVPPPAMITRTVISRRSAGPEALRCDPGALGQGGELGPANLRVDLSGGGLRGEAAVIADEHVLPSDELRVAHGELGDQLGMLD